MTLASTTVIPDSLAELDQWLIWRSESREGGKPTKVPYQVNGNGASSTRTHRRGVLSMRR
jgi:primase-polymerase (primpol)-like protein